MTLKKNIMRVAYKFAVSAIASLLTGAFAWVMGSIVIWDPAPAFIFRLVCVAVFGGNTVSIVMWEIMNASEEWRK